MITQYHKTMSNEPSFSLAACPICSSLVETVRPRWWFAANTSRKRGYNCYSFFGCKHTDSTFTPMESPKEWAEAEKAWSDKTARLFAERTASWPPDAVERLRLALGRNSHPTPAEPAIEPLEQQKADASIVPILAAVKDALPK